jgi:hypothetical protein
VDATQPLFMQVTNWVGHCRAITRLQSGRMAIALEQSNIPEWRTALNELLNIHQPELWIHGHFHQSKTTKYGNTNFICLNELEVFKIK